MKAMALLVQILCLISLCPAQSNHSRVRAEAEYYVTAYAEHYHVDISFARAIIKLESDWQPCVVSSKGAVGLMQVQPETADTAGPQLLGRKVDVNNPADNAEMGAALLRQLLSDTNGDVSLALADYYQGQGSVASDGIQPDTQTYVEGVLALDGRFKAGAGPP